MAKQTEEIITYVCDLCGTEEKRMFGFAFNSITDKNICDDCIKIIVKYYNGL